MSDQVSPTPDWAYELQARRDESDDTIADLRQRLVAARGSWLKAASELEALREQMKADEHDAAAENDE